MYIQEKEEEIHWFVHVAIRESANLISTVPGEVMENKLNLWIHEIVINF